MIPASVTTAVDSFSGAEYTSIDQVWAFSTTDWPMYRHDATHSGAGQSGPTNLYLKWNFTTNGAVVSSPTVAQRIAYFGSQDKNIYAVDVRTGTLLWKYATQQRIGSSPAVVNGKVYTGADDGYVYCLDAYNGNLLWKSFAGGDLPARLNAAVQLRSSPTVIGGIVYVGALDNKTYALNADTGDVIWTYSTQGPITSSPAVADGAVYITSQEPDSGALYKLAANNGDLLWKQSLPYMSTLGQGVDMHASPVVADGLVIASSNCAAYYGINATTGDFVWTYINPEAKEFIVCSPVYANDQLIIVDHFAIVSVDSRNGSTIWWSFIGDELYVSPTFADGKLYVVTDQRHLFVLNATNGNKLNSYNFSSNTWSSPTLYEGDLYVANNDWNVYCFGEATLITEAPAPSPSVYPSDSPSPFVSSTASFDFQDTDTPVTNLYIFLVGALMAVIIGLSAYMWIKRKR
jgi:outer membrane protein assembly factor BamB